MKRCVLLSFAGLLACLLATISVVRVQAADKPIIVGILLLDKPFITEFAGPLDVYHHVPAEKLKVFIISDTDRNG